ncbi:MAG: hypothetical protein J7L69_09825 [Desulfobulbaceae bacterium]|nr:hypothetical protein [Desulfobulbaceae bacterium]
MAQSFSFLLRILILNLLITAPALAGENPWDTRLPFKKATINYSITGTENGSETLYIRNYGKEQATYRNTTTKIFFMTTKTESIQIITPDWIYSIDLQEKTGSKSVNPTKYMIEEYNSLSRSDRKKILKNSEELGHSVTEGLQGEIKKNVTKILGYSCDKVSVMGSTIYMISGTGLPLKSETSMAGMSFQSVATGIDKGSAPANVFIPPAGIKLEHDPEADQMARTMAKQTIEMLLDPDKAQARIGQHSTMPPSSMGSGSESGGAAKPAEGTTGQDMQDAMEQGMDALRGLFGK